MVAAFTALAGCLALLGRAWPAQATLPWLLLFALLFCLCMAWLSAYSSRLHAHRSGSTPNYRQIVLVEAPLLTLSFVGSAAIYLSDGINHQLAYYLQPTPDVVLLLTILCTVVVQEAVIHPQPGVLAHRLLHGLTRARPWALPFSLVVIGLLQGSSFLWIVGGDFGRYWSVADAIRLWVGYPATAHLPSYVEGGMYPYSIELPAFPMLLLLSFTLAGHDTLAAHLPALVANCALPLIVYAFFRKAGLNRPLSYAAACSMVLFPFLRLYTLNAPVPDAIFVSLLTATGYLFLHLIGPGPLNGLTTTGPSDGPNSELRTRNSEPGYRLWAGFGLMAGLTTLTRPEGIMFVGAMFVTLLPNILKPRLYLAGGVLLAATVPFSLLMLSTFGIPWPRNAGSSFALENIVGNLNWIGGMTLPFFADPFGLPYPVFITLICFLVVAAAIGTLWIATRCWQMAALPAVTAAHIFGVFTVDPRVSGVDQWFDFYRHLSYGTAFLMLPLLFVAQMLISKVGRRLVPHILKPRATQIAPIALAILLLLFSAFELRLMAQPSRTWGSGANQLLTADVWVTLPDLIAHRYQLPMMPQARVNGVLLIDPKSDYMPKHLDMVREFFEPYSSISTGKGSQYEVSTLLVVLFGAIATIGEGLCAVVQQSVRVPSQRSIAAIGRSRD